MIASLASTVQREPRTNQKDESGYPKETADLHAKPPTPTAPEPQSPSVPLSQPPPVHGSMACWHRASHAPTCIITL